MRVSSSDRTSGSIVDGVPEDRPVGRLVQQPPHHDARMVPIAQDHLRDLAVESLGHLRRRLQEPAGKGLLVDHQPNLVAQVELIAGRHGAEEADRVEAHRLGQEQVAPGQVGIVRPVQPDGIVRGRVRALQEDALAVEPEIAVVEAEIAEAAARRDSRRTTAEPSAGRAPSRDTDTDRSVPRDAADRPAGSPRSACRRAALRDRVARLAASHRWPPRRR